MIAEIIGWIATAFRATGMISKHPQNIKFLVSLGNVFWLVNGIMTMNKPLIASNAICVAVMLYDIIKPK